MKQYEKQMPLIVYTKLEDAIKNALDSEKFEWGIWVNKYLNSCLNEFWRVSIQDSSSGIDMLESSGQEEELIDAMYLTENGDPAAMSEIIEPLWPEQYTQMIKGIIHIEPINMYMISPNQIYSNARTN